MTRRLLSGYKFYSSHTKSCGVFKLIHNRQHSSQTSYISEHRHSNEAPKGGTQNKDKMIELQEEYRAHPVHDSVPLPMTHCCCQNTVRAQPEKTVAKRQGKKRAQLSAVRDGNDTNRSRWMRNCCSGLDYGTGCGAYASYGCHDGCLHTDLSGRRLKRRSCSHGCYHDASHCVSCCASYASFPSFS
jgi:hypothetical protein